MREEIAVSAARQYRDDLKEEVQNDKTVGAGTFDLDEVLPLSTSNEGDICYRIQLNNYNRSVYGFHDRTGYYYLWNESIARCGASDIASCMIKYLGGLCGSGSIKNSKVAVRFCW